jgi:hypothetical protein
MGVCAFPNFLDAFSDPLPVDYVIQTALNQAIGEQREQMCARVRSHLMSIKREPRPKIEPKHIVASES